MKQVLLFFCCLSLVATAFAQRGISGDGPAVKQKIEVADFSSLGIGIPADVLLTQGNTHEVVIEAPQNIIDIIEHEVKNGSLNLEFPNNRYAKSSVSIKVYVTMPTLEKLNIGGKGTITAQNAFNGLGDVKFNIGGMGRIEMKGSAESAEINIGGKGEVLATDFKTGDCEVNIGGSGEALVHSTGQLKVAIAGNGKVRYTGSPAVKSSIAGSGTVQPLGGE